MGTNIVFRHNSIKYCFHTNYNNTYLAQFCKIHGNINTNMCATQTNRIRNKNEMQLFHEYHGITLCQSSLLALWPFVSIIIIAIYYAFFTICLCIDNYFMVHFIVSLYNKQYLYLAFASSHLEWMYPTFKPCDSYIRVEPDDHWHR